MIFEDLHLEIPLKTDKKNTDPSLTFVVDARYHIKAALENAIKPHLTTQLVLRPFSLSFESIAFEGKSLHIDSRNREKEEVSIDTIVHENPHHFNMSLYLERPNIPRIEMHRYMPSRKNSLFAAIGGLIKVLQDVKNDVLHLMSEATLARALGSLSIKVELCRNNDRNWGNGNLVRCTLQIDGNASHRLSAPNIAVDANLELMVHGMRDRYYHGDISVHQTRDSLKDGSSQFAVSILGDEAPAWIFQHADWEIDEYPLNIINATVDLRSLPFTVHFYSMQDLILTLQTIHGSDLSDSDWPHSVQGLYTLDASLMSGEPVSIRVDNLSFRDVMTEFGRHYPRRQVRLVTTEGELMTPQTWKDQLRNVYLIPETYAIPTSFSNLRRRVQESESSGNSSNED
jgi:hypothetical protein